MMFTMFMLVHPVLSLSIFFLKNSKSYLADVVLIILVIGAQLLLKICDDPVSAYCFESCATVPNGDLPFNGGKVSPQPPLDVFGKLMPPPQRKGLTLAVLSTEKILFPER